MEREEAIRRIKAWNLDSDDREVLATIIPELRESEDERIRMALIKLMTVAGEKYVASATGFEKEQLIAYLEKLKIFSEKGEGVYSYRDGKIHFLGKLLNNSMYMRDAPVGQGADGHLVYMEDLEDGNKKWQWSLPEDFEEAVYKVTNFIPPFDSQDEVRRVSHRFAEQLKYHAKKELEEACKEGIGGRVTSK